LLPCAQLEVRHRGWLHVFVATSRAVQKGAELCVQYPRGFWRGRARALEAFAAADLAVDAGRAAPRAAAAPAPAPRSKKARHQ